jgi:hypothetical protein
MKELGFLLLIAGLVRCTVFSELKYLEQETLRLFGRKSEMQSELAHLEGMLHDLRAEIKHTRKQYKIEARLSNAEHSSPDLTRRSSSLPKRHSQPAYPPPAGLLPLRPYKYI